MPPHCVRARGRNTPHYKGKSDEEVEIPRISFDYFFLTKEDETGNKNPMVVMVDESSGEKYARSVSQKGLGEDGEMEWLLEDMRKELKNWGTPRRRRW